jgi:hypothetical protein
VLACSALPSCSTLGEATRAARRRNAVFVIHLLKRTYFASGLVDGLLYVIGGTGRVDNGPGNLLGSSEFKSLVEIYGSTRATSRGAPSRSSVRVGDQIYVFGGSTIGVPVERSILTYNKTSNSWSAKAPMPNERLQVDCITADGAVYLVGGYSTVRGEMVNEIERYDPCVETWSSPTRLNTPRLELSGDCWQANHHDGRYESPRQHVGRWLRSWTPKDFERPHST